MATIPSKRLPKCFGFLRGIPKASRLAMYRHEENHAQLAHVNNLKRHTHGMSLWLRGVDLISMHVI